MDSTRTCDECQQKFTSILTYVQHIKCCLEQRQKQPPQQPKAVIRLLETTCEYCQKKFAQLNTHLESCEAKKFLMQCQEEEKGPSQQQNLENREENEEKSEDGSEQLETLLKLLQQLQQLQLKTVKKVGLKPEQIDKLNTIVFKQSQTLSDEYKKCVVCQTEYEVGEELTILPCVHRFHKECIGQWIKDNTECPICKHEIEEK